MLYCFDCQQSFAGLHDLCKHERVYRRMTHCKLCDVWFTTAKTEKAHILEKRWVSTGCQTKPLERNRIDRHLALITQRDIDSTTHEHVDPVGVQLEVMSGQLLLPLCFWLL